MLPFCVLGNMSALVVLNLEKSQLAGLPPSSLQQLSNLKVLVLRESNLGRNKYWIWICAGGQPTLQSQPSLNRLHARTSCAHMLFSMCEQPDAVAPLHPYAEAATCGLDPPAECTASVPCLNGLKNLRGPMVMACTHLFRPLVG
jgi:hypothetical protein